jgi:arsenate reductase
MEKLTIYHNPRCSKSRAALAILQAHEFPLRVVEYLKAPLTRGALASLHKKLGLPPGDWIRKKEPEYKQAGLGPKSSEAQLLDAMAKYPVLMERPIVVRGNRAVVGRPPERVLEIVEAR